MQCRESDQNLIDLHSCLFVHDHHQTYAGRQIHRLALIGGGWKIRYRVLLLIDRDVSQGNITFVLRAVTRTSSPCPAGPAVVRAISTAAVTAGSAEAVP